jgi:hypothetical protein
MRLFIRFIVVLFALNVSVSARPKPSPVCLILPALDTATIGFSLTREEKAEFRAYIVKKIAATLSRVIEPIQTQAIPAAKNTGRTIGIFSIDDYYMEYGGMGSTKGHIHAFLRLFDSSNSYATATLQLKAKCAGEAQLGENNPFRSAISAAMQVMDGKYFLMKSNNAFVQGDVTLDETVNGIPLMKFRETTVFVLAPKLTEQTIGYQPLQKESFHITHFLAQQIGGMLGKPARLVTPADLQTLGDSAFIYAKISPQMVDDERGRFCVALYNGADSKGPYFEQCTPEMDAGDWSENHIFIKNAAAAFVQLGAAYKKAAPKSGSDSSKN